MNVRGEPKGINREKGFGRYAGWYSYEVTVTVTEKI